MFFETTILGNTADLAMVQKMIIDTSTKRVSHRGSLLKEVAVQGVLYQSTLNAKLTGRKKLWKENAHKHRDEHKLENSQAKPIQTLGRASQGVNWSWSQCIKSHHAQTSSGKGYQATSETETSSEASYLAKEKNNWTLLSGPKSPFQMKVILHLIWKSRSQSWRKSGETQNPCCLKSSVSFTVSDDLGCNVICWCWSTVFSEVHSQRSRLPGNFRALHASFCWQALWRLGTCPHCQRYQKLVQWPWCYCAWLAANSPDLK